MRGDTGDTGRRGGGEVVDRAARRPAARLGAALRKIAGMPDYTAYLDHLRRCHPERAIPTERQYYEEFLRSRYEGAASRCC